MSNSKIGKIIKDRREQLDLSLNDVAKPLGVNKSTVLRWERGQDKGIKTMHIYHLSNVLYLPVDVLLGVSKYVSNDKDLELIKKKLKIEKVIREIKSVEELELLEKCIVVMLNKKSS